MITLYICFGTVYEKSKHFYAKKIESSKFYEPNFSTIGEASDFITFLVKEFHDEHLPLIDIENHLGETVLFIIKDCFEEFYFEANKKLGNFLKDNKFNEVVNQFILMKK